MKTQSLLYALLLSLLLPSVAVAQMPSAETRLLRENRILKAKVDSLQRLLDEAGALDELWSGLSGLDTGAGGWGSGVSSVEDGSLSDQELLIAQRLSSLFPETALPYNAAVGKRIYSYLSGRNPSLLSGAFRRLRSRMPQFRSVFEKYGVPAELIPLCVVESAVSINAVSPAGAAGMWQLMPQTAEGYGLRVDGSSDERFAVDKSTDAAARILRDLKKSLGSWPLAVMAYNCGAGRVRKAVIACGTTDAWTVWKCVPSETRAYLPSLLAVGYLMEYGSEYGIKK